MIDWEKLYKVNSNNNKKAGMAFEEMALIYLKSTFPKYNWDQTKGSWDGNKDFISLVYDYIWGEAKYKKNSTPIKRQDLDTTFISGLLNGKIKLIVFITNSPIPYTIADRVNQFSYHYQVTTIFISKRQLEYWLICHKDIYKNFFKEDLPLCKRNHPILTIENLQISDQKNENLTFKRQIINVYYNDFYVLNIIFQSVCSQKIKIIFQNESPLEFVKSPLYDNPDECQISAGIQIKRFFVKTVAEYVGNITIYILQNDDMEITYVFPISCYYRYQPKLIYSGQEKIFMNIFNFLSITNTEETGSIIWLTGPDGNGKSFIADKIYAEFLIKKEVMKVSFKENKKINQLLICKIIFFLNFGFLGQYLDDDISENEIVCLSKQLATSLSQVCFTESYIKMNLEGCLDINDAETFFQTKHEMYIHPHRRENARLLIVDNLNALDDIQKRILSDIIYQTNKGCNSIILLVNCIVDRLINKSYYNYELKNMSSQDIVESLKINFNIEEFNILEKNATIFPVKPIILNDIIALVKQKQKPKETWDLIQTYLNLVNEQVFFNIRFDVKANLFFHMLDLIYLFVDGIEAEILLNNGYESNDIKYLLDRGLILTEDTKLKPIHILYRKAYLSFRGSDVYNKRIANIISNIILNHQKHQKFERDYLFVLLLRCSQKKYTELYDTVKNKFINLYFSGTYKRATYYAEIIFEYTYKKTYKKSADDWDVLFKCGICFTHCDFNHKGRKIFQYIVKNAPKTETTFFLAQGELLNSMFWDMQISNSDIIKAKIVNDTISNSTMSLQTSIPQLNWIIALSTTGNRMMVIDLLRDDYQSALKIFNKYMKYFRKLMQLEQNPVYKSMWGEWQMDYARGIEHIAPQKALRLFNSSSKNINPSINLRRSLLCELDTLVLTLLYKKNKKTHLHNIQNKTIILLENGFLSEYFKAVIKQSVCEIIVYQDDICADKNYTNKIRNDIYEASFKTNVTIKGRNRFLIKSLWALLDLIEGNYNSSKKHLEELMELTKNCGESYQKILMHNYRITSESQGIAVSFNGELIEGFIMIDPRIW